MPTIFERIMLELRCDVVGCLRFFFSRWGGWRWMLELLPSSSFLMEYQDMINVDVETNTTAEGIMTLSDKRQKPLVLGLARTWFVRTTASSFITTLFQRRSGGVENLPYVWDGLPIFVLVQQANPTGLSENQPEFWEDKLSRNLLNTYVLRPTMEGFKAVKCKIALSKQKHVVYLIDEL